MFDDIEDGFETAIVGLFIGLVISVAFEVLGSNYASYSALFGLFNLAGSLFVITKFKYWASGYLIGFFVAEWLLVSFGLENIALVSLYTVVGGLIICVRFTEKVSDFLDSF